MSLNTTDLTVMNVSFRDFEVKQRVTDQRPRSGRLRWEGQLVDFEQFVANFQGL